MEDTKHVRFVHKNTNIVVCWCVLPRLTSSTNEIGDSANEHLN